MLTKLTSPQDLPQLDNYYGFEGVDVFSWFGPYFPTVSSVLGVDYGGALWRSGCREAGGLSLDKRFTAYSLSCSSLDWSDRT